MWIGTLGCFGEGITCGFLKLVLTMILRIGDLGLGEVALLSVSILDCNFNS